jgi:hypothetical protein
VRSGSPFGGAPIAHHSDGRDFEHFGCLFHAEPAKEAHFDYLHFARIEPGERNHGIVERDNILGPVTI